MALFRGIQEYIAQGKMLPILPESSTETYRSQFMVTMHACHSHPPSAATHDFLEWHCHKEYINLLYFHHNLIGCVMCPITARYFFSQHGQARHSQCVLFNQDFLC